MIVDKLSNYSLYAGLCARIEAAFKYLVASDLKSLEPGKYVLEGENVFAVVQEYDTKPVLEGKLEAHRRYIDIQYMVSGEEQMGYSHIGALTESEPYTKERDVQFFQGKSSMVLVEQGMFALFFPEDAHMPGIMIDERKSVKKVVVKVAV